MKESIGKRSSLSYLLFGLALLSVLVALSWDEVLLRNFSLALASLLLTTAIAKLNSGDKELDLPAGFTTSAEWGVFTLSTEEPEKKTIISFTVKESIIWLLLLASVFSLILLVYYPHSYNRWGAEDNIVETGQAVLLFISCGIFLRISAMLIRFNVRPKILNIVSLVLALALFLAGMEEVSWFQRVFDIETPRVLSGNKQGELNIHNFASGFFHNAYFFGAFCLFILLPFLKSKTTRLEKQVFSFFLPSRFLVFAGALFVVYDFFADAYFSNPLPQYTYFITLFILLYYAWLLHPVDRTLLLPALLSYYLLAPIIFLNFAFQLEKAAWRIGEYKELSVSVCFLLYSLEVLSKAKGLNELV